jgi:hypothetical protein
MGPYKSWCWQIHAEIILSLKKVVITLVVVTVAVTNSSAIACHLRGGWKC